SSTHWLTCQNTSLLNQIIHSAISKVTQSADTDLPPHQLSDLIRAIYTHPSINPTPTFLDSYSLYSTIRGLHREIIYIDIDRYIALNHFISIIKYRYISINWIKIDIYL